MGLAIQDISCASLAYDQAIAQGVGLEFDRGSSGIGAVLRASRVFTESVTQFRAEIRSRIEFRVE
jgi:hypothetical protein